MAICILLVSSGIAPVRVGARSGVSHLNKPATLDSRSTPERQQRIGES